MTGNQSPSPPPAPSGTGDTVRGPGCSLIAATLASRRPVRIRAGSDWLPSWYASHCDGDREHEGGVTIKTLDNPGWAVKMIPPYAHAPDRSDAGQRGMGNRPHSKSQHRAVQGRAAPGRSTGPRCGPCRTHHVAHSPVSPGAAAAQQLGQTADQRCS
ncbi:immunity 53 family protein [Streptomyces caniferus]|uniref:Immunity 53 family protein n=1 Tax=Streptomyces caniferus TaxID=285557 RepID=A0ABZ1VXG5_9ACTN|nr:Imm53 family immunity protein [Streptomyces caniferus]